jgi:toxin-antitoxin system PIN domain toxin
VIVPDVNLLVSLAAPTHAHHLTARAWWAENDEPVGIPDVVASGAVRVLTNSRVFRPASSTTAVFAFLATLREHPQVLSGVPALDTMTHFEKICRDANATGNVVFDAYIAACAAAYGATVVTFDRDFRRFKGVRVLELPI